MKEIYIKTVNENKKLLASTGIHVLDYFLNETCNIFNERSWERSLKSIIYVLNGNLKNTGFGSGGLAAISDKKTTSLTQVSAEIMPEIYGQDENYNFNINTDELKKLIQYWLELQTDFYQKEGIKIESKDWSNVAEKSSYKVLNRDNNTLID